MLKFLLKFIPIQAIIDYICNILKSLAKRLQILLMTK